MTSHYLEVAAQLFIAVILTVFGEWTTFVQVFVILISLDYITGVFRGIKNGALNSTIGLTGIVKKLGYFVAIAAFYQIGIMFGEGDLIRRAVLNLFIINEFVSVLENLAALGGRNSSYLPKGVIELAEALIQQESGITVEKQK